MDQKCKNKCKYKLKFRAIPNGEGCYFPEGHPSGLFCRMKAWLWSCGMEKGCGAASRNGDACEGVGHSEVGHGQETCLTGWSAFQNVI